ncbi:MAG: asparagine synthase (glutamine-hydrolyzing) [Planctomycetes bacterium]|nr:asparagine synthase (glutamine-hydrolyzing) [Planctomycetota bacterium]
MCGIGGIFLERESHMDLRQVLPLFMERVAHRGPDDSGMQFGTGQASCPEASSGTATWALGHRRLSILDLSEAGRQPMSYNSGRLWITFNGEVYNYLELRAELSNLGHSFHTGTDTEVILAAYAEWGEACLDRFIGMFSFLIVDLRNAPGTVFAARDRLGIKPLYLHYGQGFHAWASEPKQFNALPGFRYTANLQMIADFLGDGVLDHEPGSCCFGNIESFPAGHWLRWNLDQTPSLSAACRYWEPDCQTCSCSHEDAMDGLRAAFEDAVRLRMRADVPVGSCLSGGMDSSSIVGVAHRQSGASLHTFSSCFADKRYDEQEYIDAVNRHTSAHAHKVFPDAEACLRDLDALVYHQDEPFGSLSMYAQFCLMRAAREAEIPVLLDGQGGDESLCGYRKYAFFYLRQLLQEKRLVCAASFMGRLLWRGDRRQFDLRHGARYLPRWLRRAEKDAPLYREPLRKHLRPVWSERMRNVRGLHAYSLADLQHWSLPALLRYEDRNSMAFGIETRVPLVDHRFIEYCLQLPEGLFFLEGRTKRLFASAVGEAIPPEVRDRRTKMGFETPQDAWLAGPVGKALEKAIRNSERLAPLVDLEQASQRLCSTGGAAPGFRVASLALWAERFDVQFE